MEREIDEEALGSIQDEDEIYQGIDEHSFRHQEVVHTVIEVKQRMGTDIVTPLFTGSLLYQIGEEP